MTRALVEAGMDTRFFQTGENGYYTTVLRELGINVRQIYSPHRPLFILAALTNALWRFRPAIVFTPQFGDLLQGGIAGRLCNALILGGVRSDGFYELNSNGRRSRWMLRLAHGLIANSHCGRQNLASQGVSPSTIRILPNVLDVSEFDRQSQMSAPAAIQTNRVMAVAVGSLQPSKRFDLFVHALSLARRKAPALAGVIAGADCGSRAALEQLAHARGLLPDHLSFLGECDNIPALLARSSFLALCSEYEGFPNVILEAMAARLPVITTPVGDAERLVIQHQTGFVVGAGDIEALAQAMVDLALSSAARTRLGAEGRKRVAEEYAYELLSGRLLALLRAFAAQNRKHRLVNSLQGWFPPEGDALASEACLASQGGVP
jgi:starch synthase (maltosyl-transferring)